MQLIFLGPYIVPSPEHHRNTNRQRGGMLIVIEFFIKDQPEFDSPELDSPLPSSSELEEELDESELQLECSEKMWNMLSVQHCMPLAFYSHSIHLESENRGSQL